MTASSQYNDGENDPQNEFDHRKTLRVPGVRARCDTGNGIFFPAIYITGVHRGLQGSVRVQTARFAHYVAYFRQKEFFLRRRKWNWRIERGDAHDGAVEVVESVFIDDRGDFSRESPVRECS